VAHIEELEKMLKDMLADTKKLRLKRAAKLCLGSQEEQRLVEAFAQIEAEKSALGLSTLEVNIQAIRATNKGLDTIIREMPVWRETSDDVKSIRILMLTFLSKVENLWATNQHRPANLVRFLLSCLLLYRLDCIY
jgi:hypothetical protein